MEGVAQIKMSESSIYTLINFLFNVEIEEKASTVILFYTLLID
jgi:hypothetical protein